ncbi:MAG TPA: peptidoglycan-binding protein [Candidatus Paceibacterota bacterium]|nr:peptidoglycan-binding protein [Candidatus Paceibacterota bacterium]
MNIRTLSISAALALALSFGIANADTPLSVSCSGVPSTASITWTASATGGVAPIALLWGNGSTSTSQTLSYSPGTYSIGIQATDASSSVATSTCSAMVAQPVLPSIASFTASPASITSGQSSTLSWTVSNASSTSLDNGIGAVGSTSYVVSPTTTTTYTLTAVNPVGTTTAQTIVVVIATSTSSSVQAQIQALLQQILQLQLQLKNLLAGQFNHPTTTPPVIPPGQIGKGFCVALNRNLRIGDDGDDVRQLQQMLAGDSRFGFSGAPTGFFGPLTARAMMRFQMLYGIASSSNTDGSVGPLTRGFFQRNCGAGLGNNATSTTATSTQNWFLFPGYQGKGQGNDHGNGHGDN